MARIKSKKPSRKPDRVRGRPKRRTRERGTALAAYAHDVRTALTGILALSELLASSDFGERERQWALTIKSSAEHLVALSTSIIETAKVEASTPLADEAPATTDTAAPAEVTEAPEVADAANTETQD